MQQFGILYSIDHVTITPRINYISWIPNNFLAEGHLNNNEWVILYTSRKSTNWSNNIAKTFIIENNDQ